jgi:hypothetical protein
VQQDSRECHKCLHCASARPYYVRYYKLKTQMILIKPPCKMPTTIPDSPVLKSPGSSPRIKDECDDFMCIEDSPLDLRINCGRLSPGARDSGTESDDTEEKIIQEGADCKPYKKSLIKRCKSSQNDFYANGSNLSPAGPVSPVFQKIRPLRSNRDTRTKILQTNVCARQFF